MIGELTNHVWQSTVFAAVVGLLTAALRKNRAQVRYCLWFSASLKFFLPFSLLMSLGSHLEWILAANRIAPPAVSLTMEQITQPFPDSLPFFSSTSGTTDWMPIAIFGVWLCGFGAIALIRFRFWRHIRAAVRASFPLKLPTNIEVRSSPGLLEPGVVGLLRPILLLPSGIVERLTPRQLEAVLAHELCHVRRRDNLTAAIHMIVEAIFWFHPLVWWIGAQMVKERERACDEDVLRLGSEPQVYAEAILSVCKYYLESPLVCVSGITGSDLKKRIEAIITRRVSHNLDFGRKLLLASVGTAAVATPLIIGMMNAPLIRAQSQANASAALTFEVASVKPVNPPYPHPVALTINHGRVTMAAAQLRQVIGLAYGIQRVRVEGGSDWLDSEQYDIEAKTDSEANRDQVKVMLQALLADRFKLVVHHETRQLPVLMLVLGKGGSKLGEPQEAPTFGGRSAPTDHGTMAFIDARSSMANLVNLLANETGRPVLDKTGLPGPFFNIKLEWVHSNQTPGSNDGSGVFPADSGPSIFAAVEEQLGLKLESQKGPVEILVVDHAERASSN